MDQDKLRQALQLGLAKLRQQQAEREPTGRAVQALLSTGRIRHLAAVPTEGEERETVRQKPPTLPGMPVSEILIAQRRGEL